MNDLQRLSRAGALVAILAFMLLSEASAERLQVARTARSVGLGGSLTALANDATAAFWNPSGIPNLQRQELLFSYANRYGIGLKNSHVSYVFPLFERHAIGMGWTREGFDDAELSDAIQVFNVAYGMQLHRSFSLGVDGKFVFQNIDLNGTSLRSARGVGFDVGALFLPKAKPFNRFRFGVTLQDIAGTSVRDQDSQVEEEILPQSLRFGVAYLPRDDLTFAVDVDEFIHFGTEFQPTSALILRGGVNRELQPPEGANGSLAFALGLGLRWNTLSVDYGYEYHPVLPATHHASVSYAYNPSLVSIKDALVRPSPVFKSLYRTYEESDFVDVVLRNASQDPLPVTVSIDIPTLTATPHEESLILAPQTTQRYGFTLTFPQDLLASQSAYYDNLVQPTVKVTYTRGRKSKTTSKRLGSVYVLGKGKLSWSNPKRIAAFITPESRTVDTFARGLVGEHVDLLQRRFPRNNVGKAALVFDALGAHGLRYQQDQTTPYLEIFEDDSVFDTVKYPYEFLQAKIGDCDDCTAIFCSMLENLNIPTAILDVGDPEYGHIYMMFDSGIPIEEAGDFFVDEKEYVIWEGRVWMPVETTLFGSSFSDAWRNGAEEYHIRKERGYITEIRVSDAQQTFKPGVVPDADIPAPPSSALNELFDRDLAFFENRLDRIAMASGVSLDSAEGLYDAGATYLRLGQLDKALDAFNRSLKLDPTLADAYNAKGVILTRRSQYDEAIELYRKALSLNPGDAGFRINIALTYHIQGRGDDAKQAFQEAARVNREFAGMFDFLTRKEAPTRAAAPSAIDPLQAMAAQKTYDDGAAYLRLGVLDKALAAFDRALSMDPNNADALNGRGVVFTHRREYAEAVRLYNEALRHAPEDAGFLANLAIAYHLQGRADDAARAYRRAIEIDPEQQGRLDFITGGEGLPAPRLSPVPTRSAVGPLQRLAAQKAYDDGAAYLRLGAHDKALDAFDRALSMDPDNAEAHNGKGIVFTHRRQYAEAIEQYQRALQLDPNRGGYHINLAITHHLQGKREEALREYRRAVELDASYRDQLDIFETP